MAGSSFSIEADFGCSVDDLWAFISHVPNQDRWVFGMSDSEVVGGGEIGVGSEIAATSTEQGKSLRVRVVVREFEPPTRVSWESNDGQTPYVTVITCAGDEQGSRMTYDVTLYPKSLMMRVMLGPLRLLGRPIGYKVMRDEIAQLRELLERGG